MLQLLTVGNYAVSGGVGSEGPARRMEALKRVWAVAQGFVIVNADDFGLSDVVTDATLRCFEAGAITSASEMVWMPDSARAASLAREQGVPIGLHLNLDTAFTDVNAPASARTAQARVTPWFVSPLRHHIGEYNVSRTFQRALDTSIEAQLEEFRARHGCEPTHIDGHHHVQLAWNVLTSKAIPDGTAVRTTRRMETTSIALRALRSVRERWLRHRFRSTDYFYDLRWLAFPNGHPEPVSLGVLNQTGAHSVEVMVHPGACDELVLLCSEKWTGLIGSIPTGSFADLS